jgi:hypothetical protein
MSTNLLKIRAILGPSQERQVAGRLVRSDDELSYQETVPSASCIRGASIKTSSSEVGSLVIN